MTWSRTGDLRDTPQRYADVAKTLRDLGGTPVVPVTEQSVDMMLKEITRLEAKLAPPERDAAYSAAHDEFYNTVRRYITVFTEILDRQKVLARVRTTDDYKLLGGVDPRLLAPPELPQRMLARLFGCPGPSPGDHTHAVHPPTFRNVPELRQATRYVLQEVHDIDAVRANLAKALEFENQQPEVQNRRLIFALASRIGALEDRIDNLEIQLSQKRRRA